MNARAQVSEVTIASGDQSPLSYDRPPTFSRMSAETDVAVPMRDVINLSIDIYRPDAQESVGDFSFDR
jgi:uncharacterized protein